MKTTRLLFLFIVLSSLSAQAQERLKDFYLKGKWSASCPIEVIDHASFRQCELCPFVLDTINKSQGRIKDIEMTFHTDSVLINQYGKKTTVHYLKDKDSHAISFTLDGRLYHFRLFMDDDRRILQNNDGMLLILTKAEK